MRLHGPKTERRKNSDSRSKHILRRVLLTLVTLVLLGLAGMHLLGLITLDNRYNIAEDTVASVLTPLQSGFSSVVESVVNHVGVEVNTASAELLSHVSGLNKRSAVKIIAHRDEHGEFKKRAELKKVTWPTRKELLSYTGVVFIATVAVAMLIWIIDAGFSGLLRAVIK